MGPEHCRMWASCAAGFFLAGFDLFILSQAIPRVEREMHIDRMLVYLPFVAAALGAVLGFIFSHRLIRRFGRRSLFRANLFFLAVFGFASALSWNFGILVFWRVLIGMSCGADFISGSGYLKEFLPARMRKRLVVGALAFVLVGAATAGGALFLMDGWISGDLSWRWMLALSGVPALWIAFSRRHAPESSDWYMENGHSRKAALVVCRMVPEARGEIHRLLLEEELPVRRNAGAPKLP